MRGVSTTKQGTRILVHDAVLVQVVQMRPKVIVPRLRNVEEQHQAARARTSGGSITPVTTMKLALATRCRDPGSAAATDGRVTSWRWYRPHTSK
jgi:hypothetical protein